MINQDAVEKVERHVTDALAKGARRVTGGKRAYPDGTPTNGTGTFYAPTVLAIDASMAVHREETRAGGGGVLVRDGTGGDRDGERLGLRPRGVRVHAGRGGDGRVAEALECGIVGANTGAVSAPRRRSGG